MLGNNGDCLSTYTKALRKKSVTVQVHILQHNLVKPLYFGVPGPRPAAMKASAVLVSYSYIQLTGLQMQE